MTLLEEIQNGENAALEFKEARPKDSLKFTKTVVAFANGKGGRILFGVEDKTGRLVGIPRGKVALEMDAIADTVVNTCTPHVSIDIKPTTIDGKVLIALDVKSGDKTPYYVKSLGIRKGTFIRVGATTREVEEHKLKSLILAGENLSLDKQPVKGSRVTKKEVDALCRMMTETAEKNCRTEEERKNVKPMSEKRLVSMGLISKKSGILVPSYGFHIVSGEPAPGIMQPKIKCGVFRGVQKGDFVDRRTCEGSVVTQIEEAYAFLLRNIRVGSEILGTQRRDVYELPLDSIREAICNAVFHRDYLEPSSIYVALYDDRLEILSPGGLVKDFSLEDAINGFSKLRNNALGDALEYMKEVEAWGGGVSRYFTACAASGLPPPTVTEEAGFFKVVFWRKPIDPNAKNGGTVFAKETLATNGKCEGKCEGMSEGKCEGISEGKCEGISEGKCEGISEGKCECYGVKSSHDKIIEMLSCNPSLTREAIAVQMGLSVSRVEKVIRQLRNEGSLIREGSSRNGCWKVVK